MDGNLLALGGLISGGAAFLGMAWNTLRMADRLRDQGEEKGALEQRVATTEREIRELKTSTDKQAGEFGEIMKILGKVEGGITMIDNRLQRIEAKEDRC